LLQTGTTLKLTWAMVTCEEHKSDGGYVTR
jgi:hypothetical protein